MAYLGGKNGQGVYHALINQMPPHAVYIEPFLGGGAIMRLKQPARLNIGLDLDARVVRDFAWRPAGTAASGDSGRTRQARRGAIANSVDSAGSIGDGGGYRRLSPQPAIHPDPKSPPSMVGLASIDASGERIRPAADPMFQFKKKDGIEFLRAYKFTGAELVYCDPPYMHEKRGRHRYKYEFTVEQHAELLHTLKAIRAPVMISGYWTKLYADTLRTWRSVTLQSINRAGDRCVEWVWLNFPEPVALHDYRYLGNSFRERERIKKKKQRWVANFRAMPLLERQALFAAIADIA